MELERIRIVVWREGLGDWRWYIHDWLRKEGKPWWAAPLRRGGAMTERGAHRKARRAARDEVRSRQRTDYTLASTPKDD